MRGLPGVELRWLFIPKEQTQMRLVDLDNPEVVYCGEDGDYVKYNIPEDLPVVRWIRCNEKLPIGRGDVLVSCHDDSGDTSWNYTSCGWMTTDGEYWIVDGEENHHVVAWMPFPEPYKRGR